MILFHYGNIFDSPPGNSIAHCISQDAKMSKGIALEFVSNFPFLSSLRNESNTIGTAVAVPFRAAFIYNLVSKCKYWMKPTLASLYDCLSSMRTHAIMHGVTDISVPQLGCGCDKLNFEVDVLPLLFGLFATNSVHIHIYSVETSSRVR